MRPGFPRVGRAQRPGMSRAHCTLIRLCPCAACLIEPAGTIHHLKLGTGERGMALRSTDQWGVPLCLLCHEDIERAGTKRERETFLSWGVEPMRLAQELWAATGQLEVMRSIVRRHRA